MHVHSSYSLLEGALTFGKLADLAKADAQPALALTDTGNLFGALEFSEKMAGVGIQPIIGCALALDLAEPSGGRQTVIARKPRIVLLAAREAGWRNLMTLVSRSFLETPSDEEPRIALDWLSGAHEGLIAMTGGPACPIDRALALGHADIAAQRLDALADIFGDRLYVEVERHGMDVERLAEPALLDLAYAKGLPLVASNEPFFGSHADYEAHDALICIAEGRMVSEASAGASPPSIASRPGLKCSPCLRTCPRPPPTRWRLRAAAPIGCGPRNPFCRASPLAKGRARMPLRAEAAELERQAKEGLAQRLAKHGPADGLEVSVYEERLAYEISIITRMKFPGYFLIVSDFIKWAKAHDIPVGPGRGSGAGSLVAYSLQITDLDPLRFGCCSSASSIPTASPCRTSTWTSARTDGTR